MGEGLQNICYYNTDEYSFHRPYSETTAQLIDEDVKKMIAEQYDRACRILSEHREQHALLAERLVEREVVFAEDVEEIFGPRPWTSRTEELLAADEKSQEAEEIVEDNDKKIESEEV
ncbi:MAG: cell division protein FtsH, partial [Bacteroidaceae bacterium]|nr:cell division protein FtsH [Bacteroidaceae bacterium]